MSSQGDWDTKSQVINSHKEMLLVGLLTTRSVFLSICGDRGPNRICPHRPRCSRDWRKRPRALPPPRLTLPKGPWILLPLGSWSYWIVFFRTKGIKSTPTQCANPRSPRYIHRKCCAKILIYLLTFIKYTKLHSFDEFSLLYVSRVSKCRIMVSRKFWDSETWNSDLGSK